MADDASLAQETRPEGAGEGALRAAWVLLLSMAAGAWAWALLAPDARHSSTAAPRSGPLVSEAPAIDPSAAPAPALGPAPRSAAPAASVGAGTAAAAEDQRRPDAVQAEPAAPMTARGDIRRPRPSAPDVMRRGVRVTASDGLHLEIGGGRARMTRPPRPASQLGDAAPLAVRASPRGDAMGRAPGA